MRTIKVGCPSGVVKMALWAGTDDEEWFAVKSIKRGKPYVQAYGIKYYLTDQEIHIVNSLLSLQ